MSSQPQARSRKRRRGGNIKHRDGHMLKIKRQVQEEPYAASPDVVEQQFAILDSLEETAERMKGVGMFRDMHEPAKQNKIEIPITRSFSMFIQNIVYTTGVIDVSRVAQTSPASANEANVLAAMEPQAHQLADALNGTPNQSDLTPLEVSALNAATHGKEEGEEGEEEEEEDEARISMSYITRALRFRGCQFNAQRFESVILRSERFESATLIFSTGKIVNTGCCRPEHAILQLSNDTDVLRRILPYETRVITPHLENLVSSGAFPNTICTHYMTARFPNVCSEVGGFPGTLIEDRRNLGDRVIIVFDSGRICHSGGRSPTQIYKDLTVVMPMILACQSTPERIKQEAELRRNHEALASAQQPQAKRARQ